MDFNAFVASRFSIRRFDTSKTIPQEVLLRVLEAGRMAPSAANRQAWKIMVVQTTEYLEQLQLAYHAPWFANVPAVILVKGILSEAWQRHTDDYNSIETDLAILMDHLILAAHAEGLATCWIAAFDPDVLRTVFRLSQDEVIFAMTPIGYAAEGNNGSRPKVRKELDEIVEWY